MTAAGRGSADTIRTLPADEARAIMWRFADRFDLQMLVKSARGVARGVAAKLVAAGARNTHEWTPEKMKLLEAFDEAGLTAAFLDTEYGGYIPGPKNMVMALITFEMGWVDAGAATSAMAGNLGLAPIHERGTPEQRETYMKRGTPPQPGEDRKIWRGAFALTEPLPYVGVETGILSGKLKVVEWPEGGEPVLQLDKRGRFITNMGFADYVTVAVDTGDPRIKSSCMVIIERGDPGLFDRGTPTRKMVHQLSSTSDPVFSLRVPASRIIGGYAVKDGVIVPHYNHSEMIEAVFKRTRVTVGLMGAAALLSAVEPVIRYQRTRFRGAAGIEPGSLRYELGLQQREDALHRLVDVWAFGEACASLGFEAARVFDVYDPLEKEKDKLMAGRGIAGGRAEIKALMAVEKDALELVKLSFAPADRRDSARYAALQAETLVKYLEAESLANVLCPACKLFNTGMAAAVMREAVGLMGGYGITEDCPGWLMNKWTDLQLEATYEGPEAVQRRQLSLTMTSDLFVERFKLMIAEIRGIASTRAGAGAETLARAMELWLWTLRRLQNSTDAHGGRLYTGPRQGVTFAMADALCWLLASHCQMRDVLELEEKGPGNPAVAEGLSGLVDFLADLAHVQAARAAGEAGRICAELVHGYMAAGVPSGPAEVALAEFARMRASVDASLAGARLAKDRAGIPLTKVMIPEAPDYPV
jgi:alkylation response protein AidB-like acyl-CoA dehydrogenase